MFDGSFWKIICKTKWFNDLSLSLLSISSLLSDIVKHFPNINFWKVNQIQWDIAFYRALRDWEHGLMEDFLNLIHSSNIQRDEEDIICWMPTKGKLSEVKSFHRVLRGVGVVNFPWKSLQGKSPFESSFFCLVCCFREDLRRQGIIVVD